MVYCQPVDSRVFLGGYGFTLVVREIPCPLGILRPPREMGPDPMRWVKALDSVAFATGSHGALMMPITGGVLRNVPFTETISGAMDEYFRDGWHLRDERMRAIPIITKRGVADDFDGHSADAIAKHPFY